jgi:hypothetical protein
MLERSHLHSTSEVRLINVDQKQSDRKQLEARPTWDQIDIRQAGKSRQMAGGDHRLMLDESTRGRNGPES